MRSTISTSSTRASSRASGRSTRRSRRWRTRCASATACSSASARREPGRRCSVASEGGNGRRHVLIVGGGFAGVGCARGLAPHDAVKVTLVDPNNYHHSQPPLYQVATCQLAGTDIASSLRRLFRNRPNVDVHLGEVTAVDPAARTVTTAQGERLSPDAIGLAAGPPPDFFPSPGAPGHPVPP